jgi:hypothetical protein
MNKEDYLTREDLEEILTRVLDAKLDVKLDAKLKHLVTEDMLDKRLANYPTKLDLHEVLEKQRKEYERYVGALSEDFQSSLTAVAEFAVGTSNEVVSIKEYIEFHKERHAKIDSRLNALEAVA